MTKAKLRKLVIVLSSIVALSGGFSIEAAYARGGGGGGHAGIGGGFGGHMGGFGGAHFGGGLGMGRGLSHEGMTRMGGLGFHHHRSFGPDVWGPRCGDWLADFNPVCTLPN
jgi:hypothetical protein